MSSLPAATAATLLAQHLHYERGGVVVLDDVSLTVDPDTCLGVVGPNGVGKSTLLRILAGQLTPASGRVKLDPASSTVGYLEQEHAAVPGEDVRAALYRQTGAAAAEAELAGAAVALGKGGAPEVEAYAAALSTYESLSAGDFEARLAVALGEVGLALDMAEAPTSSLSGGQAARVGLAAIRLARFDITLLDEPTNDLDFDGLARLEEMVARRRGGMVIVSHDRAFLDGAVTDVLELDEHSRQGRTYGGGWTAYQAERATERSLAAEQYAVYTAQRTELRRRAQRERQWATSGVAREKKQPRDNDKAQRDFRINRTEKQASRARRTERALEQLESDAVEKPWEAWDLRFTIGEAARSGDVVARLEDAVIRRDEGGEDGEGGGGGGGGGGGDRGPFTLGPLTLDIGWAERVALVGPNGSGKTTLVEALLGRLPLAAGVRRMGPSVIVGELAQDRRILDGDGEGDGSGDTGSGRRSVADAFVAATGLPRDKARAQLAKFGLGSDAVLRAPSSLSPGERTRAELAAFAAKGVNFLVLDEPTNHLDLPAIEQLEAALDTYRGTLLLVSHDRRLLEAVRVTRRVMLPGRDQAFRGLSDDR